MPRFIHFATVRRLHALLCALAAGIVVAQDSPQEASGDWVPEIPRVWDEEALADWATPLAGLNARPSHMSAEEYYSIPVENLRSYPVYMPGLEPEGYWKEILDTGPAPLIDTESLETKADWIAGRSAMRSKRCWM